EKNKDRAEGIREWAVLRVAAARVAALRMVGRAAAQLPAVLLRAAVRPGGRRPVAARPAAQPQEARRLLMVVRPRRRAVPDPEGVTREPAAVAMAETNRQSSP